MNKETILDILINNCEISRDKTGEVRYEYSQEQFEQIIKKLVNKTNDIHDVIQSNFFCHRECSGESKCNKQCLLCADMEKHSV